MHRIKTLVRDITRRARQRFCRHEFIINQIRRGAEGNQYILYCFCPKCGLEIWVPDEVE